MISNNNNNSGLGWPQSKKAADCSLMNRKDAAKEPVAQQNYSTYINTL